jgi:hypothetical protein
LSRHAPSLLATLVSTAAPSGELDIEAIVELLAAKRLSSELPMLDRRSTTRGVQLLIDVGPSMTPFEEDVAILISALVATVGNSRVRLLQFADTPLRGNGSGRRRSWSKTYDPPPPETPVLVLTELGIGGDSTYRAASRPEHWLRLQSILRRQDSPVVALVPYPASRWPRALNGRFPIVTWDRRTTLQHVHEAVKDATRRWT